MNYNKDLYQILGVNKNANQQEIDNLALVKSSKDNTKVNKALMVLTDPQKRIEYNEKGWQPKWDNEFEEWLAACNTTFKSIHSHIGYGVEAVHHPDGEQIWLMGSDLDPKLWVPFNSPSADANWINKIYSINGLNWRNRMKEYEKAMLAEIERVRAERQKTPFCKANWEYVDSGTCAKCGKKAKIRDARGEDTNVYCSQKCYYNNWENRYKKYYDKNNEQPEDNYKYLKDFEFEYKKQPERNEEPYNKNKKGEYPTPNQERNPESHSSDKIEQLKKEIEHYQSKKQNVPEEEKIGVQKIINELEKELKYEKAKNFFSKKGEEQVVWKSNRITGKTTTVVKKNNPLLELLNWMKKEGIVNISLNAEGNLVVEYGKNNSKSINDNELTREQKEIKAFFQQAKEQGGETNFNRRELEEVINRETKEGNPDKNKNDWAAPVIIGMGALILVLIGVIVYKSKKKGY